MKKTILITGSTDGIGKGTAIKLAKDGHTVYLHGRNPEKLASAIEEVKRESHNRNIKGFIADFSDLDAVRCMGAKIIKEVPKIDVLINNAGIFKSVTATNKNGLDIRIVVNYLAPFTLTNALIPILKNGVNPRIINLSSAAQSTVSNTVLLGDMLVTQQETYAQSKLALTMWSFNLAEKEPSITIIAVNPGSLLNTKMAKEAYGNHWSPAEKGINILYDLSLSEDYNTSTGKYFDNDKGEIKGVFSSAHPDAYDTAKIAELLRITKEIVYNK